MLMLGAGGSSALRILRLWPVPNLRTSSPTDGAVASLTHACAPHTEIDAEKRAGITTLQLCPRRRIVTLTLRCKIKERTFGVNGFRLGEISDCKRSRPNLFEISADLLDRHPLPVYGHHLPSGVGSLLVRPLATLEALASRGAAAVAAAGIVVVVGGGGGGLSEHDHRSPEGSLLTCVWCEIDRWWEVQRVKVRGGLGLRYRATGGL